MGINGSYKAGTGRGGYMEGPVPAWPGTGGARSQVSSISKSRAPL